MSPCHLLISLRQIAKAPNMMRTIGEIITAMSTKVISPKVSGRMTDDTPSIRSMLKMFEPITFPKAIWLFFLSAALIDAASSGSEVPTAITVIPIKASLTPKLLAIELPELTKSLPPMISPASPRII